MRAASSLDSPLRSLVGTLPYVAPEVLRDGSASEALDHWAVGVLLFELIVGEPPFSGETPKQMLSAILSTTVDTRPLSRVAASLVKSLLNVDFALRLGASGFEEIQAHAFFAFTLWDKMIEQTPPFVPQLSSGDDDAYFPQALLADVGDIDMDSDTSDDSESESFKQIQGVNVDHLISLARRRSSTSNASNSNLSRQTDSPSNSTPNSSTPGTSIQATPPTHSRTLKSPGQAKMVAKATLGSKQLSRPLSRPL